jgi:hypothetical protein
VPLGTIHPEVLKWAQGAGAPQLFKLMQQYGMLNEVDYKTNQLVVRFMSKTDKLE